MQTDKIKEIKDKAIGEVKEEIDEHKANWKRFSKNKIFKVFIGIFILGVIFTIFQI